jgi:hypothetical protein
MFFYYFFFQQFSIYNAMIQEVNHENLKLKKKYQLDNVLYGK